MQYQAQFSAGDRDLVWFEHYPCNSLGDEMGRKDGSRAISDFIDHYCPDFIKNFDYFTLRRQILDNPSQATIAKVKRPIRFAAMGTLAPFAIYFGGLALSSLAGIPTVEQSIENKIAETLSAENRASNLLGEIDKSCEEMEPTDVVAQSNCKVFLRRDLPEMRNGFAEYRAQLEIAQNFRQLYT